MTISYLHPSTAYDIMPSSFYRTFHVSKPAQHNTTSCATLHCLYRSMVPAWGGVRGMRYRSTRTYGGQTWSGQNLYKSFSKRYPQSAQLSELYLRFVLGFQDESSGFRNSSLRQWITLVLFFGEWECGRMAPMGSALNSE